MSRGAFFALIILILVGGRFPHHEKINLLLFPFDHIKRSHTIGLYRVVLQLSSQSAWNRIWCVRRWGRSTERMNAHQTAGDLFAENLSCVISPHEGSMKLIPLSPQRKSQNLFAEKSVFTVVSLYIKKDHHW